METVATGVIPLGTPAQLARQFGVSVAELRAALRTLLEQRKIAVGAEASGQISIRLERRLADAPPLPPAAERRRPARDAMADLWIV